MKWRFVILGIVASFGALWGLDYLMPDNQFDVLGLYVTTFASWMIAFSVGGFVAGRDFLVPAVVSALLVVGGIIVHTAYLVGQHDLTILPVVTNNLPILIITVSATATGSRIGTWVKEIVGRQADAA